MSRGASKLWEIVRALGVVALIFLNFAHAPLASSGQYAAAPSATSFCGDPIDDPTDARGDPCQACRIGSSADLPPPPIFALAAFQCFLAVGHAATPEPVDPCPPLGLAGPRAPPAI